MKVPVFDFDGVLVDSTTECWVIARITQLVRDGSLSIDLLNNAKFARDQLQMIASDNHSSARVRFEKYRRYVRWPREYFLLMEPQVLGLDPDHVFIQEDFDEFETEQSQDGQNFERLFFEVRKKIKLNCFDNWIELFTVNEDVIEVLARWSAKCRVFVLTGRDKDSVLSILNLRKVEIAERDVYDAIRFKNKREGLKSICIETGLPPNAFVIIDDNIRHLQELLSLGACGIWATWGYVCPDHFTIRRNLNVIDASRNNIAAILEKELLSE